MKKSVSILLFVVVAHCHLEVRGDGSWPPALPGAKQGTATVQDKSLLAIPPAPPEEGRKTIDTEPREAFDVARVAPKVELAFHDKLGEDAVHRRLWSSWGDICLAADGRVYSAIGDHGNAVGGDARAFLYQWDPQHRRLTQRVDFNRVAPRKSHQPAWSKVHAKIDEDQRGMIYVSCTLNDGNRAKNEDYQWSKQFPGGQLYQFDPESGKTEVFASLPPKRCTATSRLDRQRDIWWCNLEAGEGNALWGLDLKTRKPVCQTADGAVAFNRAFALLSDGTLVFNGSESLQRLSPKACEITSTKSSFAEAPGMRCASRPTKSGVIYGVTYRTNELFAYDTRRDRLQMLGPAWGPRGYTTVIELSPDEKFLYYLPGAHGQAWKFGTPVVQYNVATKRRKVLAFLAPTLRKRCGYVPGGTYGVKLSEDGGTLYVNFNGHAADANRPSHMKPNGFGLCAFVALHIPSDER